MLYHKQYLSETTLLGIWKIEETIDYYLSELSHKEWLEIVENTISVNRKKTLLATRLLLKHLVGSEKHICYLESGKPYLSDRTWNISISHTKDYVAIVVNKERNLGLDIEQRTDKVLRVEERFIGHGEYIEESNKTLHLLLHWSAKEAAFKYLNPPSIDFTQHLQVKPFEVEDSGKLEIRETISGINNTFCARYIIMSEFVLVCII